MSVALAEAALKIAIQRLGIREIRHNRGPEIDEWISRLGLKPEGAHPWCAAFVYDVVACAAKEVGCDNPLSPTAKVSRMWRRAPVKLLHRVPYTGSVFCHLTDLGDLDSSGHCGFVEHVTGDHVCTVEGNTNELGSREGDKVARQIRRMSYVNLGFIRLDMAPSVRAS